MEIYLTDVDIAYCILANITKAQGGEGLLKIIFPQDYNLSIDYSGSELNGRVVSIDGPNDFHREWKGGNIVLSEIKDCLDQISNKI